MREKVVLIGLRAPGSSLKLGFGLRRRLREDRPDLSANMHIDIISLFPRIASAPLAESMIGKAQERGLITIRSHNLRDWATDKHRTTDDTPYGGSQGMVLKCEPLFAAVEALRAQRGAEIENRRSEIESSSGIASELRSPISDLPSPRCQVLLMSPAGRPFTQRVAEELALVPHLILICGHYEGVDQRVIDHLVDGEISIGDYVLTNGALAAAVVTDAIARLLPGVLGDARSAPDDSHSSGLLEFPQYTRPVEFRGWRVPDVLLSGHHGEIAKWRKARALEKTERVRPDLLKIRNQKSEI
jgi:tRNA (guanine37-N1)-methyltransferase